MKVSKILLLFVITLPCISSPVSADNKSPRPAKPATSNTTDKQPETHIRVEGIEGTVTAQGHEKWISSRQTEQPETTATGNPIQVNKASPGVNQTSNKTIKSPNTSKIRVNQTQR